MFTALRIAAVVGVIFYLSPVRRAGDPPWPPKLPGLAGQELLGAAQAASTALPDAARRPILDRLLGPGSSPLKAQEPPAAAPPARDTLQAGDLQPEWRGDDETRARPPARTGARAVR